MSKRKFMVFLQQFSGDGSGGDGGQQGQQPANDPEGGAPNDGGNAGGESGKGKDGGKQQQPFAIFPDEQSFMSRVSREAKKMQKELLKELGIDSVDTLKTIIQTHKDLEDKNKSELERAQERAQQAEQKLQEVMAQAQNVAKLTEAKLIAMEIGVNPARIDHFLKLADLSNVEVDENGNVDTKALKDVLGSLLKELPEFKKTVTDAPQGGTDGFQSGNQDKPKLTLEQIKRMSKEEIAARIDEVREVMAQQQYYK